MKKLVFVLAALCAAALPVCAQIQIPPAVPNASSTGTSAGHLVKLTGAPSTTIIATAGDTQGVIGICDSSCSTSGFPVIATAGVDLCAFDGATTAGDYVQISATVNGDCTDSGAATVPTSGEIIGRVLSTIGSAGNASIVIGIENSVGGGGGGGGSVSAGTIGQAAAYNSSNTVASIPLAVYADAITGAGIGAAPVSWVTATTYPLCQVVSHSGNFIATSANNGSTTPGANLHIWYPIPNGSRPTQFDCAFYIAQASVTGGVGVDLQLGAGTYNACIGMTYANSYPNPGAPGVNIHGIGVNSSIIKQTCTLLSGSGGDGLAMLNVPTAATAFFLPRLQFTDFTLDGHALAPAIFDLHACQQCVIRNVDMTNPAPGTDHIFEAGTIGGGSSGWVYELEMVNSTTSYNPGVTGFGHGNGAFTATVTVSSGVPTITVTNGGSAYDTGQLKFRLVKAGGLEACSSVGTFTPTLSGGTTGTITALTTTSTGCQATGLTFVQIYTGIQVAYSFKFSNMTDSHLISDLIPGGVGSTAGVYISNVGNMNAFYKLHPIATFNGIQDLGSTNYYSTQIDSVTNWGYDFEGLSTQSNLFGSMFEWNSSHYNGSSDYHFGTTTNPPTSAPSSINIYGDTCGNVPQQSGYGHFVVPLGVVDTTSNPLPGFVTAYQTQYCNLRGTNAVQPTLIANSVVWSNGTFPLNKWTWNQGNGTSSTMTLGNRNTVAATLNFLNSNPATSGANQSSNIIALQGQYWDGTTTQPYGPRLRETFAAGTEPFATFSFDTLGTATTGGHLWKFDSTVQVGSASSATTTVAGAFLYDTTNKNLHLGANSVDNIAALVPSSVSITNGDCVNWSNVSNVITLADAGSACGAGGGGGFANPMTTLGDMIYGGASGTASRLTGPTGPNGIPLTLASIPSGSAAVAPAWLIPGLAGRAVTGTTSTDPIVPTDCSPNRIEYVGSVSVGISLPTATTLGVPGCVFRITNDTSGSNTTLTITPSTWTINGASTLVMAQGQIATIYVDPSSSTNWVADVTESALTVGTNVTFSRSAAGLTINSSACTSSGSTGVLQASNGSGGCAASSLTDNGTKVTTTEPMSSSGAATATVTAFTTTGTAIVTGAPAPYWFINSGGGSPTWASSGTMLGIDAPSFAGNFLDFHVNSVASIFSVDANGTIKNPGVSLSGTTGAITGNLYATGGNCANAASPAVCGSSPAGSVVIAAGVTSVQVNTNKVTANSQILITEDSSLGTRLSVTCNTQSTLVLGSPTVTARAAGTSFTITLPVAPTTNPACYSYLIFN